MAKKFRDEYAGGESAINQDTMDITLSGYVTKYAPDIMKSLTEMRGENPVDFFSRIFEKAKKGEEKQLQKSSIKWAYAQRVVTLARSFIALDHAERRFVMQAADEKIWWRGDDMKFFNTVVTETYAYRGLTPAQQEKYRKQIWRVAGNLTMRHAQQPA